jgi:hypothetical protein
MEQTVTVRIGKLSLELSPLKRDQIRPAGHLAFGSMRAREIRHSFRRDRSQAIMRVEPLPSLLSASGYSSSGVDWQARG